jgi:RNA polymerase sigma factor (sigma-70 family)
MFSGSGPNQRLVTQKPQKLRAGAHSVSISTEFPPSDRWFAEEVQPHGPALRAFLLARFPSLPDVDDLVQDSVVRVLRAREVGAVRSPRAFLFATARNLALDQVRRQQAVGFECLRNSDTTADPANVAEQVSRQQELDLLREAIQSLPDRCRQVFTLRTAYGLSQREVAARLGISENTVEKQMAKGLERCTEFFARHGLP